VASKLVSTRIRVDGFVRRMAAEVETPSPSGIRRSRTAMSGCSVRAASCASCPVPTQATTVMSVCASSMAARPSLNIGWSSAMRTRIVTT
jgi:hypothetical protein